jgi:hypothetical protein
LYKNGIAKTAFLYLWEELGVLSEHSEQAVPRPRGALTHLATDNWPRPAIGGLAVENRSNVLVRDIQ